MIDEKFVIVGAALSVLGGISYLIDTLKGKTRPNRVSWFLWALAPLIAFFAEIKQGVGLQSLMTFTVGFSPLLIFIASFINRKSSWKLTKFDAVCGALSLVGIALWLTTKNPDLAIAFSLIADALASAPTVVKSYKEPESESYSVYLCSTINATITMLALDNWNFAHSAFPIYILAIDVLLVALIKFKLGAKINEILKARAEKAQP